MNAGINHITLVFTFLALSSGCIEPYQPPAIVEDVDILVIDGFLNSTDGSATVRLTHANALSDQNDIEPEFGAAVSILEEGGNIFTLPEQGLGTYTFAGINIDPTAKYQLSVNTVDGGKYLSDYVEINPSPVIDSVTWEAMEDGVNILVNTHDVTGTTRYYRWEYVETWEYYAPVSSDFILVNGVPVYRTDAERICKCWRTLPTTKISIASTVRLAEDVIHKFPITFLPKGTSKVSVKYSILVKQRGVSKNEFDFLQQLQKTTESVGGLFDPQPSQVVGNIHNQSNPSATVLGYFSAGAVTEERFFLDYKDLPDYLNKLPTPIGCEEQFVCVSPGSLPTCALSLENLSGSELLGTAVYATGPPSIIGYTLTTEACADCRVQGGTLNKPPFWP